MSRHDECQCGHTRMNHPFGHSENLSFDGHCMDCDCRRFMAASARPEAAQPHICSGCHLRWEGPLTGAELCGDCWRKAQTVVMARPEAAQRVKGQWRDAHGKHKWEDAAMKIVSAIHDHIAPTLDENDGGEILSWILQFAEEVERARPEAAAPLSELFSELGLTADATIASVQRRLRVGVADAMRLLALREVMRADLHWKAAGGAIPAPRETPANILARRCYRRIFQAEGEHLEWNRELQDPQARNNLLEIENTIREALAAAEAARITLREKIEALIQRWDEEVASADFLNRATSDLSTWGCVRYRDGLHRCVTELRDVLALLPPGGEPQEPT